MRWVPGVGNNQAGAVFHVGGLGRGSYATCGAPEQGIEWAVLLDLRPEACLEGCVLGALLLDDWLSILRSPDYHQ